MNEGQLAVVLSVDPLSLAADLLYPLIPAARTDGRSPVAVPRDLGRLAKVCAILRDTGGLPSVAAVQGVPVGELERLAALDSDYGGWW